MTEKQFNVFDVDGTVFLEDHKEGSYHIGEKENVDIPCLNDIADRLNTYADENEQLKREMGKQQEEIEILSEEKEQLKREIEDFQTLLASKEELYIKPVIGMIDEKMEQCALFGDSKCAVILSELKQELKGDVQ